jgi:hypothetical protein
MTNFSFAAPKHCSANAPAGNALKLPWQFAIHFAAEGATVIACGRNDMALS